MAYSDDDQPFVTILKAMGIGDFDPLVPVALNEYAARKEPIATYYTWLLCCDFMMLVAF